MDSDSDSPATYGHRETSAAAAASLERQYLRGGKKSLSGIAVRSFCLGAALASSIMALAATLLFTSSPLWRLPFFFAALSVFHFSEFYTTARYSTHDATVKSFLLTANWPAYAIAHASATLECLVTNTLLFPPGRSSSSSSWLPFASYSTQALLLAGIGLVMLGQTIRSTAMAQAGPSFNHIVQHRKRDTHVLVTSGVYGYLRHPSYFGFFWWAVGTQLVLGNVVCLAGYAAVLWKFFSSRVRAEEASLVRFFGSEYETYRQRVGTKMPLIG